MTTDPVTVRNTMGLIGMLVNILPSKGKGTRSHDKHHPRKRQKRNTNALSRFILVSLNLSRSLLNAVAVYDCLAMMRLLFAFFCSFDLTVIRLNFGGNKIFPLCCRAGIESDK
jgi:hypothetical protein